MIYLLAAAPIVVVLVVMAGLRWGGQRAGPVGWLAGLALAAAAFGLTPQVFAVSQLKGLYLSFYVLWVMWPALLLYNVVNQVGGVRAIAGWLEGAIGDRGLLLVTLAWIFSAWLEGLAGFGLPIAVVAPMLAALGVEPVLAVAAVAVGHAWSVTFGDMGVIYQTLIGLVKMDAATLAPAAALMLGVACLACGLAAAALLGQLRRWPFVLAMAAVMAGAQYLLAVWGLTPLAAFGAGLAGLAGSLAWGKAQNARKAGETAGKPSGGTPSPAHLAVDSPGRRELGSALGSYGGLSLAMVAIAMVPPIRDGFNQAAIKMAFPAVVSQNGFATAAGTQVFRPLTHPGTAILLVAGLSYLVFRRLGYCQPGAFRVAAGATWRSAAPATVGIVSMVGLSALMDHSGMTLLLAEALSKALGAVYPLVSPLVGILGAFATGSNNNSNVLFASLQQNAARILAIDPRILLAAQTTGGSLGSMLAPAKLIVGCSTVGLKGKDGLVLRRTLPIGLAIGVGLGILALIWSGI